MITISAQIIVFQTSDKSPMPRTARTNRFMQAIKAVVRVFTLSKIDGKSDLLPTIKISMAALSCCLKMQFQNVRNSAGFMVLTKIMALLRAWQSYKLPAKMRLQGRNPCTDASQGLKMAKLNVAALARKYLKGVNSGNGAKGQTRRSLKTRTDKGGIQRQVQISGRAPSLALA